jgi:ubiquinone/menaquinone biosynthesis C-methylase UbiE
MEKEKFESKWIKDGIKEYWDGRGRFYDSVPGHGSKEKEKRAWLMEFKNVFGENRKNVLDVGTGTGFLSLLLADFGHEVTGIDMSEGMLSVAKEKAQDMGLKIHFERGDAENLPFDDQTFDGVVCRHLLWTLPNPEKAIAEWIRVTKQGGKIAVIDGVWDKGIGRYLSRVGWILHVMITEKRNPIKNNHYPKEVRDKLPYVKGIDGEEIASFLSNFGLKEISVTDLGYIREIQKKYLPWYLKFSYSFPTFLVSGLVSRRSELKD